MTEAKFCKGPVEYTDSDGIKQIGYVEFPCGARIDPNELFQPEALPYRYQILRERARIAKCCYWRNPDKVLDPTNINANDIFSTPDIYEYNTVKLTEEQLSLLPSIEISSTRESKEDKTVSNEDPIIVGGWKHETNIDGSVNPSFIITPYYNSRETIIIKGNIPTKCVNSAATEFNQGLDNNPPCNGAKTRCPFYTGYTFQYINDEDLDPGKPILGQMIQEIRSFMLDWNSFPDPQKKWEDTFNLPYIWGKDFDTDLLVTTEDSDFAEIAVFTILTQVYWNVLSSEATLINIPGSPVGTEVSKLDPPDFPTIINELGEGLETCISITYPYLKEFEYSKLEGKKVTYICGKTYSNHNIYIINSTLIGGFPKPSESSLETNLFGEDIDSSISSFINNNIYNYFSNGNIEGFGITQADSSGFWEIRDGIALEPNSENEIYALVRRNNKWYFDKVLVYFNYILADIWQEGFISTLSTPSSDSLPEKISGLSTGGSNGLVFKLDSIGNVNISNIYHYTIHDRIYQRFLFGDTKEVKDPQTGEISKVLINQNQRTFSFYKDPHTFTGTGLSRDSSVELVWIKVSSCNKFLVCILRGIPLNVTPGLDRSWEPTDIVFQSSTKTTSITTETKMKVLDTFGRDLTGDILPTNCFFIEPEFDNTIENLTLDSNLVVTLDVFKLSNTQDEDNDIVENFIDNSTRTAGGIKLPQSSINDELKTGTHTIVNNGSNFIVSNYSKHDLSYIVELSTEDSEGTKVIGYKWVYGVGELNDSWVRDVDITYIWSSFQKFVKQIPDYWRAIKSLGSGKEFGSSVLGDSGFRPGFEDNNTTKKTARCFDHDSILGTGGSLFYPYDKCSDPMVEIDSGVFSYRYRIPYATNIDEKYRGPDLSSPTIYRFNVLAWIIPCIFDFSWGTFFRTQSVWNGTARLRGPISENFNVLKYLLYKTLGYRLPQFGNSGRDHLRVTSTMHYRQYLYIKNGKPTVGEGWLPAIPYLGKESIFDRSYKKPTIILDKIIEDNSKLTIPINNIKDYKTGQYLLSITSSGSSISSEGNGTEQYLETRKKFDDVFRVKRVRTPDGKGSMWPPEGYYYNFKEEQNVDWTFSEPELNFIYRNTDLIMGDKLTETSYITGIIVSKPTTQTTSGFSYTEKFGRPIDLCSEEGEYFLGITDQQYDDLGFVIKYASIQLLKEDLVVGSLYFDRFFGELKEYDSYYSEVLDKKEIYAIDSLVDLGSLSGTKVNPLFEDYRNSINYPTDISTISGEYIKVGNLIDTSTISIFSKGNILEEPLDDSLPDEWVSFFKGLKIENIIPNYLPSVEEPLENVLNLNSSIRTTPYPGTPEERVELSGKDLPYDTLEGYEWKPLSEEEAKISPIPSPDPRIGSINPITIVVNFNRPIAISLLNFSYTLYGNSINSYVETTTEEEVPIDLEPSISIVYDDYISGTPITIISKPSISHKKEEVTELDRVFNISISANTTQPNMEEGIYNINIDEPLVTKQIIINIGNRQSKIGIIINNLTINNLRLNESIKENIIVLEKRISLTGGLTVPNETNLNRLPAQGSNYLSSITSSVDISDPNEYSGIAEYWRPKYLDKPSVGTLGKLRRHWASQFNSYDADLYFYNKTPENGNTIFYDKDVDTTEARQGNIIKDFYDKADVLMDKKLFNRKYKRYTNLSDLQELKDIGGESLLNKEFTFKLQSNYNGLQVSKGPLPVGWQDYGYEACIKASDSQAKVERCTGGPALALDRDSQGICRKGAEVEAPYILDLASKVTAAGALSSFSGNSITEKMNEISTTTTSEYRLLNKKQEKNDKGRFNS